MNTTISITAIIPARSGSKRIPKKNIKIYSGYPLIYWSIQIAKKSKYINEIILSTDDQDIAYIGEKYGAKVLYLRPNNISGDLSTDYEFIKYHINNVVDPPDLLVQLRPTYPNRKLEILDDCIKTFIDNFTYYDSLRTVCELDKPVFKMYYIKNNMLIPFFNTWNNILEPYNQPSQIFPKTYWHNGYIDIIKVSSFIRLNSITGNNIYPYIMNKNEIDDIDTIEEWNKSEVNFLKM